MKKISKIQIIRIISQIAFLFIIPGFFILVFGDLKQIYNMILNHNNNFAQYLPSAASILIVIPITIILGRFFCGWMCAFGALNDFIHMIFNKIIKINLKIDEKLDSFLKKIKYFILAFIVYFVWTKSSNLFKTMSPWDAFAQLPDFKAAFTQYTAGFILLVLILFGAVFIERFFCRYLCPLGAIFSIISKIRIFNIDKPTDKCGKCRICTNSCSTGISLYKMNKVNSGECINCLKCINVCPRKNIHASILNENLSPLMACTFAIAAVMGIYTTGNILENELKPNKISVTENIPKPNAKSNLNVNINNTNTTTNTIQNTNNNQKHKYKDGTYTGEGVGFRPGLEVSVTIKNDKITDIQILSSNDSPRFSYLPFQVIPQEIIKAQSTNVDAISGATRSSEGIMMAVNDALSKARN